MHSEEESEESDSASLSNLWLPYTAGGLHGCGG